ncbi:hypothetical protein BU16DRAFT_563953 [Lophium mytilinum]|uniref:Uncharacterized protein n=1 Tax=Lophium mytilinum TaxID=390894 RepID=A0A6A6QKR6_9PEZI|nr:hypothetical protein BU16DRAFT_563953 [Lophium mytilinum]
MVTSTAYIPQSFIPSYSPPTRGAITTLESRLKDTFKLVSKLWSKTSPSEETVKFYANLLAREIYVHSRVMPSAEVVCHSLFNNAGKEGFPSHQADKQLAQDYANLFIAMDDSLEGPFTSQIYQTVAKFLKNLESGGPRTVRFALIVILCDLYADDDEGDGWLEEVGDACVALCRFLANPDEYRYHGDCFEYLEYMFNEAGEKMGEDIEGRHGEMFTTENSASISLDDYLGDCSNPEEHENRMRELFTKILPELWSDVQPGTISSFAWDLANYFELVSTENLTDDLEVDDLIVVAKSLVQRIVASVEEINEERWAKLMSLLLYSLYMDVDQDLKSGMRATLTTRLSRYNGTEAAMSIRGHFLCDTYHLSIESVDKDCRVWSLMLAKIGSLLYRRMSSAQEIKDEALV